MAEAAVPADYLPSLPTSFIGRVAPVGEPPALALSPLWFLAA
jgi:hypothetical protein